MKNLAHLGLDPYFFRSEIGLAAYCATKDLIDKSFKVTYI